MRTQFVNRHVKTTIIMQQRQRLIVLADITSFLLSCNSSLNKCHICIATYRKNRYTVDCVLGHESRLQLLKNMPFEIRHFVETKSFVDLWQCLISSEPHFTDVLYNYNHLPSSHGLYEEWKLLELLPCKLLRIFYILKARKDNI